MPGKIRAFIAVDLPDEIRQSIRDIQQQLRSEKLDFRWVDPANIHLTIKFLGDIEPENSAAVCDAMKKAVDRVRPFKLHSKGFGGFPGLNRPRVIWTGIGGETAILEKLATDLDAHLADLGFEKEARRYKGHLTLGRAKGAVNPVQMLNAASRFKDFRSGDFIAQELVLFKSTLKPGGPVYENIFAAALDQK